MRNIWAHKLRTKSMQRISLSSWRFDFSCTLKSKLRSSCNVDFEVWWIHVQCMHFAAANSVCKSNEMFIIHNTNTNINDLTWLPVILLLLFRLLNVRKSTKQKLLAVSFSAFELSIAWVTLHAPHEFRKISPIFHFRCMCVCVYLHGFWLTTIVNDTTHYRPFRSRQCC